ncbi:phosphocholine-specific phospholipase C [Burkholderia pseudomallei]|uniref:phospholipase C n=2 Tax=Burkholderia pseudomallei TaxID=28450 RepID=A0A0H3HU36_BURP2|nr:phospholipase C, phosphocholine-specific [Burkholderia pseudomallei]AFI68360.1 phospholipase C [Burkholderia pseudomallei 1026b]AIO83396.1 phospholipase C, phosphocholine-specific [Burkholderia pseudomallei]AIP17647.1 phospholipase C, phosphocholine-specific [Burkholderia pseudomallei]AIP45311.1 phospholipase C, phosphocholine-specific [Burkholderia pseudomallei MSHR5858]AJW55110.1 phospholipase C [Burkholderia pseudomallei]
MNARRRFLQGTATTGIAAATLAAFPLSIRRALAIPANNRTGTIRDVEHIVILMQENRSFDNYFGTLRGVRGFGDRFGIPLPNALTVWQQRNATGALVLPYHLDGSKGNAQRVSGTPHSWDDGQNAWDGGRMYQWPRYKNTASMGYFRESELPFQFALANAFTICDAYHCSMHAGTNSNRMFMWTGTNGPTGAGVASVVNEWDDIGPSTFGYEWKTYPERLQEAGVSWKVYQNMPDNFTDNALAGFRQYRRANEASGKPVSNSDKVVSPAYDPASDDVRNPLYKGIANTMPDGGFLGAFKEDIRAGKLPQVSWVVAPAAYSEHPGPSSPVQGAWYIQEVLDALTATPDVWSKTVLLVNFDENDGYFDHVPSPSAPSLNPDGSPAGKTTLPEADIAFERFTHPKPPGTKSQPQPDARVYGPGVRVPMYVISPWSRGGWVNSQVFDHTSTLRFIEARFGVREPNISAFRRAVCGDLTSAFNFVRPNNEPLPTLAGRKTRAQADALRAAQQQMPQIVPPANGLLPRQETGTRPSRALPYELHVNAVARTLDGTLRLVFANTGQAAAVFHVYDKLNLGRLPRRYMVEAGKQLDDVWAAMTDNGGKYDLWVLGPNGLHRHFTGDMNRLRAGGAPVPEVRAEYDRQHGNVQLLLRNEGARECVFTVRAKAYRDDGPWTFKVKGGAERKHHWKLDGSGNWYDFVVTCDADTGYSRRFAGRVETGEHSVSDPAMGFGDRF